MTKIVDQLLQLAEFIESRKLADSDIVHAGTGFSASLNLQCDAFFTVSSGVVIEYDDFDDTAHGHSVVDGVPLVCVADTEPELQKLRAVGKPRKEFASIPSALDEMPF